MKVNEITLRETAKVTKVDTSTGNVTYKDDLTGVETTVPKGMATPTAQGQVQIAAQQVAPGQATATATPVVNVGDIVDVIGQTGQTQTMGSMEEDEEEDIPQTEQPYDDQQMEAIKKLAGL